MCPSPGVVLDRMTSRKAAITLGFAAGAMAKFGMASAGTVGLLFAGKAVDRLARCYRRLTYPGRNSPPAIRHPGRWQKLSAGSGL